MNRLPMKLGLTGIGLLLSACNVGIPSTGEAEHTTGTPAPVSPKSTTYLFDDLSATLVNGHADIELAPGTARRERIFVVGEPVYGDLDKDGDEDAGVVLIRDPGSSGTFYFLAAAVKKDNEYGGTNALFLGDRIDGVAVRISDGVINATFRDRADDAPFSAPANVPRSVRARLNGTTLQALSDRAD